MGKEKVGRSVGEQVVGEGMTRNRSIYLFLRPFPWYIRLKKLSYTHGKGMR